MTLSQLSVQYDASAALVAGRLAQLRQKRVALGHKPDDHELEQQGFSMKFHM